MNRQLSGQVRTPGTASAAPTGRAIPEGERARFEAVGERLIRTVYVAENEWDIELELSCFADPYADHFAGRASLLPVSVLRPALRSFHAENPTMHRDIEEVVNMGNRSALRWHLTAEGSGSERISQHGCSVVEHDGERIGKFWAYYPDLAQVFPAILQLE